MNWDKSKSGKNSYNASEIEQARDDKSRQKGNDSGKRKEAKT